jgi:hypothetical protein
MVTNEVPLGILNKLNTECIEKEEVFSYQHIISNYHFSKFPPPELLL